MKDKILGGARPPSPEEMQLLAMQQVVAQRGAAAFGTFLDGISFMLDQARLGDRGARMALRQLRDNLRELDQLPLDIVLPGDRS